MVANGVVTPLGVLATKPQLQVGKMVTLALPVSLVVAMVAAVAVDKTATAVAMAGLVAHQAVVEQAAVPVTAQAVMEAKERFVYGRGNS